jgi:hypothetical protein
MIKGEKIGLVLYSLVVLITVSLLMLTARFTLLLLD